MSLPAENARSSDRVMAVIVCATVLLVGTAVSLPVPMYAEYARVSGSSKALGIAFACYAFGVSRHPCFSLAASLTEPAGGCRLLSP